MSTPIRLLTRTLRILLLGAMFFFAMTANVHAQNPSAHDEAVHRQDFKSLLLSIAERSQATPLACEEKAYDIPKRKLAYKLTLSNEPQYQDAFFIGFSAIDQDRKWSTLIAYEGKQNWVMGTLKVLESNETVLYQHSFRGYYNDVTEVLHGKEGPRQLRYFKRFNGNTVFEVICPL